MNPRPSMPLSRRRLPILAVVVMLLLAFAVGAAVGQLGVPAALVQRAKGLLAGSERPLQPPDAAASEYRRQRLALFRASEARADIVMLGDSHTAGGSWSELLGRPALNRGIGWDSSQDVLERLDEVIGRKPKVVFLLIGIVDLRYGMAPDLVAHNIEAIAARLRDAGIRVVVQSVLPVAPHLREATNERVQALNARLRTLPDYLDLHPALVRDGALDPALTHDGIHLSGPAYLRWARLVTNALQGRTPPAG
ncbi:GDSL-type esterase/lipase family protein [Ramlibacter sp. AN1015]|uniref:GDSL-type esterase/lipase family protein n=1 Tax=Ramlibacter sp. AN1015 TaxID=3133428 RepID=UPI0030C286DC